MMEMLKLHNNLTQKTEIFKPTEDMKVKMYTCGPSTYQRAHIGNYRTFLFEDILQRYLEYLGYKVTRLITLTNIEDKAIMSAEAANLSVDQLTNRNEAVFFKDFDKLHIKRPDYSVRASTIVDQAANLIKTLIEKGIAYTLTYQKAKNIYFDPQRFPGFGRLARLDLKKWPKTKRRFHLDTYPGMPWNKGDFILWHGCRERDRVCWDTDIGRGRPAWNIQDAAMVTKHLGFSIDIACGGIFFMIPFLLIWQLLGSFFGNIIIAYFPFQFPFIPTELSVANWYLLCSFSSSVIISRVLGLTFEIDPEERNVKDE